MRTGKLRRVIELQRSSTTINADGSPVLTWSKLATMRAEIIQQTATEYLRAQGAQDEAVVVFRLHSFPGLTTADRVLFGDAFNIREIVPIENGRGMELRCVRLS